jgi:hypothetical protein
LGSTSPGIQLLREFGDCGDWVSLIIIHVQLVPEGQHDHRTRY